MLPPRAVVRGRHKINLYSILRILFHVDYRATFIISEKYNSSVLPQNLLECVTLTKCDLFNNNTIVHLMCKVEKQNLKISTSAGWSILKHPLLKWRPHLQRER